ncbi:hypothetical protein [Bradyrhizobium ivorense]|uniref:hypothetical protein n=1 Tax=Bradyrhizobium ivorense TaxID=2511166 RepID=UPI00155B0267|nr:hypothetical protein [Bradyrhizobium ivorense]
MAVSIPARMFERLVSAAHGELRSLEDSRRFPRSRFGARREHVPPPELVSANQPSFPA